MLITKENIMVPPIYNFDERIGVDKLNLYV